MLQRGGGEAARESNSTAVELAGVRNRGGRWRCASWKKGYASAREGVGPTGVKEAYWRINRRRVWPVGEETGGGGGAARTPRRLEVGDGVEDWFANCKKSRGLAEN